MAKPVIPPADKYEIRFFGHRPTVCTVDPGEALAALDADGEIVAVRNCISRVAAARVNGVLLSAREYNDHA